MEPLMKKTCFLLLLVPYLTIAMEEQDITNTPIHVDQAMIAEYQRIAALPLNDPSLNNKRANGKADLFIGFIKNNGLGEEFAQKMIIIENLKNKLNKLALSGAQYKYAELLSLDGNKQSGYFDISQDLGRAFRKNQSPQEITNTIEEIQRYLNLYYTKYKDGEFNKYLDIYRKEIADEEV